MAILELRDLSLTLGGRRILDNLTADFWEGHVHAVVGPNGAGKSTLASTIMGLGGYRDYSGDIIFEGQSLKDLSIDERARLGVTLAWQEPARFEGISVRDFLRATAKDKSEQSVRDVLDAVGMKPDEYLSRAVDKTLSGGERKKIELASILAMRPKFVMLDEPDSGIDVASLQRIFDALAAFKNIGSTVIMITHSLTVLKHAEHAFLMCCGKIVEKGNIDKMQVFFEQNCIPCDHKNRPDVMAR
ncbi:ABC transporter ATP-binding protein [bacterium]|nr:ABC transporter ATP-binding protein [candidate division CSSED10-310 bacterium]